MTTMRCVPEETTSGNNAMKISSGGGSSNATQNLTHADIPVMFSEIYI
jgi:hypothetical protein